MIEELWVIEGNEPCLWTVPFYVNFENEITGGMFHAVALLHSQLKAVTAMLEQEGIFRDKGMWSLTRMQLERIGRKVELCDPETLFTWERVRNLKPVKTPEGAQERTDFLDSLYQTGLFKSRDEMTIVYQQICVHALHWLVNKERPLDLYFVRLHNCPYRMNWKHVLLSRFPRLGRLLCHRSPVGREVVANEAGLLDEMTCPDLLSMGTNNGYIGRTVEVEMLPVWHKNIVRAEANRFKLLGAVGYGKYVSESIARWRAAALRCYVAWLNLIARYSSANVECGDKGEFRLVPNVPPADVRPVHRKAYPVPVVVPNSLPAVKDASEPRRIYPKDGVLPDEMPPVRPSGANVRHNRGDLYRREEPKNTAARMLVHNASQIDDPLQLLALREQRELKYELKGLAMRAKLVPPPK